MTQSTIARYEYAAPVGALFSVILSLYSYRPLSGSVFGHPLAVFLTAPCRALFSVTYVRLQLVTIVFPILTSMAEKSRPQVFIPAGAVKW